LLKPNFSVLTAFSMSLFLSCAAAGSADAKAPTGTAGKPGARATAPVARNVQSAFGETRIFRGKVSTDVATGEKALLAGNYDQAVATFRKALNSNSKDIAALCGLGFSLAIQFKLDGAEQQFKQALAVKSTDPLAHVGMAFVAINRLQSSSMTIISQKKAILTKAEAECRLALKAEPNMPEGNLVLGLIQKEQGKLGLAKASFTKSINADPKYAMAFVNRGLIELKQNDTASAITDFQQAIALRSSNSTAHYGLGKAYLQMGQLDEAYKELNTAISLKNNSAPSHIALGDVLKQQGNSVGAMKEYKAAIAIKAESEDAYIKVADIYQGRGDLEMAAANLRSGLDMSPTNVDLHLRLGDITLSLGKCDDALKEYTTVLNTAPGNVPAVNGMTRALVLKAQKEANGAFFLSNNYESAGALIQRAIQMNPNNMQLRLADAKLRAMSGKTIDLSTIGTPTTDPERLAFAEASIAQFKFQDATQAMTTVIQNCPDAPQTFAVADMALLTRDLDSAEMAYKKAGSFSGTDVADRSRRGLAAVQAARQKADSELTFATDLARKGQLASAIDKFRSAAYLNPRLADAHIGLAEALQKFQKDKSPALREASIQFKAYIALTPDLPEKEREKISKRAEKCLETAYKIDQGHPPTTLGSIFKPVGNLGKKLGDGIKDAFQ
jgi:tetratricopeptide (TPR) repeat protein